MEKKSKDELLVSDDFIRYCTRPTDADRAWWAAYLTRFPEDWAKLEEAKTILLALYQVVRDDERAAELNRLKLAIANAATASPEVRHSTNLKKYSWFAAAVLIPLAIGLYFLAPATDKRLKEAVPANIAYTARAGASKRVLSLADGSKIVLNAHSKLEIKEGFGTDNRTVTLNGEAFFDVQHNKELPFLVQTNQYTVKVHGTSFNIRTSKDGKNTETALLKGSVEILLEGGEENSVFLKPNQKAFILDAAETDSVSSPSSLAVTDYTAIKIVPLTISGDGNSILETVWTRSSLEINDESFEQLKEKFERWYDVEIEFGDEKIKSYRFTALFEDIPIQQALEAMQLSNPFQFVINDKKITVKER